MWTLRPAQMQDRARVTALWEAAGLGSITAQEWTALVAGTSATVIVADDAGVLVGAAVGSFDGWRAYIYHVAVVPDRQHEGLGRALMREAERHLERAGARRVYVMIHEENTAGLALASSSGYVPDGELALMKALVSAAALA